MLSIEEESTHGYISSDRAEAIDVLRRRCLPTSGEGRRYWALHPCILMVRAV